MAKDKAPFLGELEALQAVLLDTAGIDPASIPLLDDIIEDGPVQYPRNSEQHDEIRFGDDEEEANPRATAEYQLYNTPTHDDDFERELFIQDLIDTMMPGIEAELRKRLLNLNQDILDRWHQQSQPNR